MGTNGASGPKKRFYNSMVVSGLVNETSQKYSLDEPANHPHVMSNRQGNISINKQLSGPH